MNGFCRRDERSSQNAKFKIVEKQLVPDVDTAVIVAVVRAEQHPIKALPFGRHVAEVNKRRHISIRFGGLKALSRFHAASFSHPNSLLQDLQFLSPLAWTRQLTLFERHDE